MTYSACYWIFYTILYMSNALYESISEKYWQSSKIGQFTDDCKISHHLVAQGKIMISITYLREKIDHMIRKHKNYK